jgi:hypothetical protein
VTEEPLYTPEEANRMLPALRESLMRIRRARQIVLRGAERIRKVATLDGGGRQSAEYWEALAILRSEVESLAEGGIVLRDPETGLIDFPTRIEGRDAFLCWRLGEDEVGYWHGPETGFAGRRPL